MSFPQRYEHYTRYLTFAGVPAAELEEWKRTMVWFLKKLTLRYRRPIVLKSPPHTARIRLLLELFPEARFVNIHRDHGAVFLSCRHCGHCPMVRLSPKAGHNANRRSHPEDRPDRLRRLLRPAPLGSPRPARRHRLRGARGEAPAGD